MVIYNTESSVILKVPAVPLIFGLRNALFLEPPSASQRQFAQNSEEARMHVTESESRLLEKRTNKILNKQHFEDSSDENEGEREQNLHIEVERKKRSTRNGADLKDRPQFKRKKAKVKFFCSFYLCKILTMYCLLMHRVVTFHLAFHFSSLA